MSQPNQGDVTCPSCGNLNRAGAKFCRKCGAVLTAAPAQPDSLPPQVADDAPTARLGSGGAVPPTLPPPPQGQQAPPTLLGVPAPPSGAPAPARRGPPWLLIFGGAAVALVLLAVCAGGGLWLLGQQGRQGASPTPVVEVATPPADEATPTPEDATPTPEDATPTPEDATPTADEAAGAQATADARATQAAERRTALAVVVPTPKPTVQPTPAPQSLVPEPGSLALEDYQAEVKSMRLRLFETFDRGERTKAIWTQFENESVAARLRDNFYALTVKGENRNMWETWDRDLGADYNVELAVAFQDTGVPTTVGIAFDVQPDGDNGVFFEVFNDKHWQLRTVRDGRLVPEGTTDRIELPALQDGVGTNVLWVVRKPEGTQLWINSVHVATVPPGPFASGYAGVVASSRPGLEGSATLIVDNFRVRTP